MATRRVVLGKDAAGQSAVLFDDEAQKVVQWTPGVDSVAVLWSEEAGAPLDHPGGDPTLDVSQLFPPVGSVRFVRLRFRTDYSKSDKLGSEQYGDAYERAGLELNTASHDGGWHSTASVDYGVVIQGTMELQMRNGDSVVLRPGDTYVQRGGDHKWRPLGEEDVVMSVVIVGVAHVIQV